MSFDELLRERAIEPVTVESGELTELLRLARRDIRTARSLVFTDLDWAFVIAYNALLQSSVAYMASLGYRPRASAKHFNTFRFMALALPEEAEMIGRLQRLRKKRNTTVYEHVGLVGESEAKSVIEFAERYCSRILDLMSDDVTAPLEDDEE